MLDITESSVRSRLFRARNLMAGMLNYARGKDRDEEPSGRIREKSIAAEEERR